MNPRIRAVTLDDDGTPLGTFPLDITKRELQTIRVAPKGTLRITIDEIEPGSKKTWREAAISELEVWGTPALGWKQPSLPLVPTVVVAGVVEKAPDPCANIEKDRDEFNRTHDYSGMTGPGGEDHNYPPTCGDFAVPPNLAQLSPPWSGAASSCYIDDEIYGPKSCGLTFASGGKTAFAGIEGDKAVDMSIESVDEKDMIPGGDHELAVRFKVDSATMLVVCRAQPTLACTEPFDTAGKDDASAIAAHPLKFP
jgi:hypothetical protein